MKVGDLVRYQDWWAGEYQKEAMGLIMAVPTDTSRDPNKQDYTVYWLRGNYATGAHGCMGKFLEVVK
jgi:hypothetical protein